MSLLAVVVVPVLILYFMTPEERLRLWRRARGFGRSHCAVAGATPSAGDPFYATLRARRRWPIVTWVIVAANALVMIAMILGPDALGTADTLVAWGGNFGPQTTTTESWRVFTSIFAHRGVVHLLLNLAVLMQLGPLLERIVGPFTIGTVYVAAGVLGSVMSTVAAPMSVFVGASGAISGLYGLLLIVVFRGSVQNTAVRVPLRVIATLAPPAGIFALYCWFSGDAWLMAKVGLWTGVVSGVVLTRSVTDDRIRLRRFAALGTATAGIVMMSTMGLRAITDVRPAVREIIAAEERTSTEYDAAVRQFTKGAFDREDLTRIIDASILPQILVSSAQFERFVDVPADHRHLLTVARQYLRVRHESWQTRSNALRNGNMRHLRDADDREKAALEAFVRLRTAAASH